MLIECYKCEAVVDGALIAQHNSYDPEDDPDVFRVYLLECPRCKTSLFAGDYEFEDGPPCRLWPSPRKSVSSYIPPEIRVSLREADKCYRAGAFLACAGRNRCQPSIKILEGFWGSSLPKDAQMPTGRGTSGS
jgi:hypothetical protein